MVHEFVRLLVYCRQPQPTIALVNNQYHTNKRTKKRLEKSSLCD